jgi:hypothetical protein
MQRQTVSPDTVQLPVVRSTEPNQAAAPASFIPQTDVSDTESQRSLEGSVTTDDSVSPIHVLFDIISINLDFSQMASMHALQSAIDKCIKQLNDRASPKTVLRAKKAVLKYVCRDYCHMTQNKLDRLRTKEELYAAAAAWVCV